MAEEVILSTKFPLKICLWFIFWSAGSHCFLCIWTRVPLTRLAGKSGEETQGRSDDSLSCVSASKTVKASGLGVTREGPEEVVSVSKENLGSLMASLLLKQCELNKGSWKYPWDLGLDCLKFKSILRYLQITWSCANKSTFASVSETVRGTGIIKSTNHMDED